MTITPKKSTTCDSTPASVPAPYFPRPPEPKIFPRPSDPETRAHRRYRETLEREQKEYRRELKKHLTYLHAIEVRYAKAVERSKRRLEKDRVRAQRYRDMKKGK